MKAHELELRSQATRTALENLSDHCCGMNHHQVWKHEGRELPLCELQRRERIMGCAHGDNLALRAAVVLLSDVGLITYKERDNLISFLNIATENIWLLDLLAIDVSTSASSATRQSAASDLGANLDDYNTVSRGLEHEQMEVVRSLDFLRHAVLQALHPQTPDGSLLQNFLEILEHNRRKLERFEIKPSQLLDSVPS